MQRTSRLAGLGFLLAGLMAGGSGHAQEAGPPLPPLPQSVLQRLHSDPAVWQQFRALHAAVPPAPKAAAAAPTVAAPAWTPAWKLNHSNPLLLTDGTVLAHVSCSRAWYRLTPNIDGDYAKGTWAKIALMPAGYAPRFFSSAVLPDGRVVVEGGEYNGASCDDVETTKGAIYDPQTNAWATLAPPSGWKSIGDASGIVLADGTYLLSNCCTVQAATLDPASLTWTATGTGKADDNNEENWTLLPDGDVLTVDAYTAGPTGGAIACGTGAEEYVPGTGDWVSAGSTIHRLSGCGYKIRTYEAPTQILRPVGKVVAFGSSASTAAENFPVYTAIYTASTGTWASGPRMPEVSGQYYTMADAPAAILPNGDILLAASPGVWTSDSSYPAPTHFFTFDGATFTQVGDVADSSQLSSYEMNFLVLPSGQILGVETDFANTEILPPIGSAKGAWAPYDIVLSSRTLTAGDTYTLTGKQLSGLTQGAAYGDDAQADTNFPLVRITNDATGHVFYARTFGFGRSVAPAAAGAASFVVSAKTEAGAGTLEVVANGIASTALKVTIKAATVASAE